MRIHFLIAAPTLCLSLAIWAACQNTLGLHAPSMQKLDSSGNTIGTRFVIPDSFARPANQSNAFAQYLSQLPLKPIGSPVLLYNGKPKENQEVAISVVDMDIGNKDLQQCADAVIRLRAEYFFQKKQYGKIQFKLTNGFQMAFEKWAQGNRVKVNGNKTSWYSGASRDYSYANFRRYLDFVFTYAGSLSLSKELYKKDLDSIEAGDVFIIGGSPGHAVVVVDVVVKKGTGERLFMLAQSYMPAQQIHILKNPMNPDLSPWYSNKTKGTITTPQWTFESTDLKSFEP